MEVHVTDGTEAGTTPLADINPGPPGSNPIFLGANNTFAFFAADDGVNGAQLWVTDGTGPGTRLVKVINPDGDAFSDFFNPAIVVDERLIFRATDGEHGQEVFISDGTEAGTGMIVDLNPGAPGSDPFNFTRANGAVLFEATADGSTYNLYQSLGTAETTDKLADSVWTPAGIAVLPATPLFFQSQATGQVVATVFQNDKHLGWSATTAPLGSEWEARAIGEVVAGITGPELFAQSNIDGRIIYTSFDSLGERQWDAVPGALTGWSLMGAGDFIGNERSEIVIRNQADGTHLLGQFDRAGLFDQWFAWTSPFKDVANNRDYQFVAAGDWNGDGIADGIFQNQLGSGDVFARSIINGIAQDFLVTDRITLDHRVTAVGDFDADGTADIVVQNQSTGEAVFKSSIFATDQWAPLLSSFAAGGVNVAAADIDQDGDSEIITEINGSFFAGHVGPPGIASWTLLANTGAGWEIVH
jgi:ELWxxDGT repeat protein